MNVETAQTKECAMLGVEWFYITNHTKFELQIQIQNALFVLYINIIYNSMKGLRSTLTLHICKICLQKYDRISWNKATDKKTFWATKSDV